MEIKKSNIPNNTITRKLTDLDAPTGNIYESVVVISKRANQISSEIKQELNRKLADFSSVNDSLEETFENREQIEISKYYERLPKPVLIATQEFEDGDIYYKDIFDKYKFTHAILYKKGLRVLRQYSKKIAEQFFIAVTTDILTF